MPILYIDNFRGFESTFLPLEDINFFVGENSTGKSSILKLLGIFSSQGFWRYNIFGEDETSLGRFSEIKTTNSSKDFFEVALMDEKEDAQEEVCAFKFRFIEHEGFPLFKEIRYTDKNINCQAIIDGRVLKYRFQINFDDITFPDDKLSFFKLWIDNNSSLSEKAFKRTNLEDSSLMQTLFQLQALIKLENDINNNLIKKTIRISRPGILNNTAWFAPTVAQPQKIYTQTPLVFNSYGNHTPSVLKQILLNGDVRKILNRFGSDSGLFDDLNIINLQNEPEDSFELQVSFNRNNLNIMNVGYGVSQILPFIIESIARPDSSWIVSQQPETHLHPKAQAALGDFIHKSNQIDKQKFVVETHSDYTIDRLRLRMNNNHDKNRSTNNISVQVVFFSRKGSSNTLDIIKIKEDGSYDEDQPKDFRDFFIKEQLSLIRI